MSGNLLSPPHYLTLKLCKFRYFFGKFHLSLLFILIYQYISYSTFNHSTNASASTEVEEIKTRGSADDQSLLRRDNAFPTHYVKSRGLDQPVYSLVPGRKGELLADYILFEETMKRVKVSWGCYNKMTSNERTIYTKHLKAVGARKLFYKCPFTGHIVRTISQLLYDGKCCGNGCRHCPYELEACNETKKKSLIWNGAFYS